MKITVLDANLSGNFEEDLRSGRLRAYDKDCVYVASATAISMIMDGKASVDGVSNNTPDMNTHSATARQVFDSIKRMRGIATVDATDAQSQPVKLSAYDSMKERLTNAWRVTDAGGAPRQRYGDPKEFEEQAKLSEEQRKTNEQASKSAQQKHKDELSNAWKKGA